MASQEILILPGRPESARAAREFTAACLPGCPSAHEAMACVDELVANAVQHSRSGLPGGTITIRVAARPGQWLRVDVEDAGPRLHVVPGDPGEPSRGLGLVDVLADKAGAGAGLSWFWMAWHRGSQARVPVPRPPVHALAEQRQSQTPWEQRRRAVLDRSAGMCQCAGQCGRPGHRCASGDAPGRPLHIVAAGPAIGDAAAARLPAGDLVALCAACRAGRDRITACALAAPAAAAAGLFDPMVTT